MVALSDAWLPLQLATGPAPTRLTARSQLHTSQIAGVQPGNATTTGNGTATNATTTATNATGNATVEAIDGARSFFEQFSTLEARLGITAAVVIGTVLVGWLVLPVVVRWIDRLVIRQLVTGRLADWRASIGRYVPATFSGTLLRVIQFSLGVGAVASVLVVWGLTGVVRQSAQEVTDRLPLLGRFFGSILLALAGYVGSRMLADRTADLSDRTEWMTDHQEEIVLRISQLGLFTLAGLFMLTLWDQSLGGLLVGAGFLGIVVGFAARQTLGSLIAGFVLMFSRPFTIGDWIAVGDQEGIVTDITIFNTRLENFDGEYVVIPNDRISDRPITNRSQKGILRLRVDVGIDYETDPEHAREVATAAIGDLDEVVDAPPPQVFPKSFGDSAVVLEMRFWIDHPTPPRKWRATSAVIRTVKEAFEREGIKVPFPQRELTGRAETGGFQVHDAGPERETNGANRDEHGIPDDQE